MSRWPTFLTHPKNLPPAGFVVDEVEPANSPLETQSMLQSITHRFQQRALLTYPSLRGRFSREQGNATR